MTTITSSPWFWILLVELFLLVLVLLVRTRRQRRELIRALKRASAALHLARIRATNDLDEIAFSRAARNADECIDRMEGIKK